MEVYFYPSEQHERKCGKLVACTLQSIGGKGTTDDLSNEIAYVIGQPKEIVKPKLKQVLRQAVREGFLIRKGKTYTFPGHEYEVDARGSTTGGTRSRIDRDRKAKVSKSQNKRRDARSRGNKRGSTSATRARSDRERKAIASKSQNKRRKLQAMNQSKSRSRSSLSRTSSKSRSGSK